MSCKEEQVLANLYSCVMCQHVFFFKDQAIAHAHVKDYACIHAKGELLWYHARVKTCQETCKNCSNGFGGMYGFGD
jgi:hypothetical protein